MAALTVDTSKGGAEPSGLRRRYRAVGGPSLGIVDQAFSSLTNFATTLLAARIAAPSRFGALALALSLGYMVMILARAIVAEPMMTKLPRLGGPALRTAEADGVAAAVIVGLGLGAAVAALSLLPLAATQDFAWVGVCLPFVLVQDALRYVAFARGRPGGALAMDVAWAAVQFSLCAALLVTHAATIHLLVLSWGAGAVAGTLVGVVVVGLRSVGSPRRWTRQTRSYFVWVLPQLVLSQTTDQGTTLLIVAVFGTAALGGVRSMQLFVRPVFVFMLAMQALLVPGLARRVAERGDADLLVVTRKLALGIGVTALTAASIASLFARPLASTLFGDRYVGYASLLLPFATGSVFHACGVVPNAALRSLQCGRRILLVQVASSIVAITAVGSAALFSTVYVTAWAFTAQGITSAVVAWIALVTVVRRRHAAAEAASTGDTLVPITLPMPRLGSTEAVR